MFNIPPARSINPAVSVELEKIINKGTDNQRMSRWSSTHELRNALLAATRGPMPPQMPVGGMRADVIAPTMQPAASSPSNYQQEAPVLPVQPEPVKSSRPTQRLIYAATQLSPWQIIAITVLVIIVLVGATALLAVPLDNLAIDWNLVPIMAFFGAFGYAAYPKRGMVFLSHTVLTSALVGTIALRIGSQGYSWQDYALAIGVSGIVMELWTALLPLVERFTSIQAWVRELIWLILMEIIGMIIFFGLLGGWEVSLNPLMWGFSALFGGIGWFLGDLIQQFILYRRTGFKHLQ